MSEQEKPERKWERDAAVYSALRKCFRSSPAVNECLNAAKSEYFITCKNGNQARRVQFECAHCHAKYPKGSKKKPNIQVDHVDPVVDPLDGNLMPDGRRNWIKQIDRLMGRSTEEKPLLQVLCRQCHSAKSKAENAIRRKVRKEKQWEAQQRLSEAK